MLPYAFGLDEIYEQARIAEGLSGAHARERILKGG